MFHPRQLLLIVTTTCLLSFSLAQANEASLVKEKCGTCHGDDGNSTHSKVPSIAGFSVDALEDTLSMYKSDDRISEKYTPDGGKETNMNEIAKNLSEADTKTIITFLASQKFKPVKQNFDAALAKQGKMIHEKKCEKCHSDNGTNSEDDAAILAGQHRSYLEMQFKLIAADKRDIPRKMKKRFKKLNDNEHKALIEFYISQQ